MKKIFTRTLSVLKKNERKIFFQQVFFDALIFVLDLFFLACLIFLVNNFIKTGALITFSLLSLNISASVAITVFFISYTVKNYFAYKLLKWQHKFMFGIAARLSEAKLAEYMKTDYLDFVHTDSSVYVRKINQQPIEFAHYVLRGWQQIFSQSMLIGLALIAIILYDSKLFFLLFLSVTPPVFFVVYLLKKKLINVRYGIKKSSEKSLQHLNEALSGFVENKIYFKHDFFIRRYIHQQRNLNSLLADQQILQGAPSRLIEVVAIFGIFFLLMLHQWTGASAVSIVTIGAFMAAAYKIIPGIVKIINSTSQIKTYEFVIDDLKKNENFNHQTPPVEIKKIDSLEFKNVFFSYDEKFVIRDFNLQMQAGDLVGLSAVSGKGKTTLINLLLGFLSPQKGAININGLPSDLFNKEHYWKRISYVKQQPFFIHDTTKKNVVLCNEDYDEVRYEDVTDMTGVNTFNNDNSGNGFIRENGKNISGGQRQKIAFARALYKNFDLLILDEPFSEMDEEAEIQMLLQLKKLADYGKMILLITHNKEGLSFCNKTISLDE